MRFSSGPARFGLALTAVLILLVGCSPAAAGGPSPGTVGAGVVLVVSGTGSEPAPVLTPAVLDELRRAAESDDVTNGKGGRSSAAVIVAAAVGSRTVVSLTPRRADGSVEHGLQREALIATNIAAVTTVVGAVSAHQGGLDLLEGIATGVRGLRGGTLVVVSNGLSTAGGFDLRQVGWNADPTTAAEQLRARGLLQNLAGWHVVFQGLGGSAGPQPPLPKPARDTLARYWTAICTASRAASCDVDETETSGGPAAGAAAMPVVPVPGVTSVIGPHGEVTTTITDDLLGFAGDSAEVTAPGRAVLAQLAADIRADLAARPELVVTVRGFTADPPDYTPQRLAALARARSDAVAAVLVADGVPAARVRSLGGGPAPGTTAVVNGRFDDAIAGTMRRVEITH